MKPAEHANLLSLFCWIYAGIQSLMFLFILLVVLMMGGMSIFAAVEGSQGSTEASIMFGVIALIYLFILAIGAVSIVLNFLAGKRLRKNVPVKKGFILATSIMNLISFMCGGIFLLPFGVALGVYGIWFSSSAEGIAYLANPGAFRAGANNMFPQNQPQISPEYDRKPYGWQ